MRRWLGVDVGGKRKGFDIALVDERRLIRLLDGLSREEVIAVVAQDRPDVIAIDSPRSCAPPGQTSREGERLVAKAICGIRWTPDIHTVKANRYYGWILEGLALYQALENDEAKVIEVFPTASWTRWYGARSRRRRAAWTREALTALGIADVPQRTNQDQRDAIAAAVTARQFADGATEHLGDIVVPTVAASSTVTP
jgi:predicted nuclease with RNAse H fold